MNENSTDFESYIPLSYILNYSVDANASDTSEAGNTEDYILSEDNTSDTLTTFTLDADTYSLIEHCSKVGDCLLLVSIVFLTITVVRKVFDVFT